MKYRYKIGLKDKLLNEAKKRFLEDGVSEESKKDYISSLKQYLVSYDEFFHQYDFPNLDEEERSKYVSRAQVQLFYYDIPWKVKENFWDKRKFLTTFSNFIYRDWIRVKDTDQNAFMDFMKSHDVICKPISC